MEKNQQEDQIDFLDFHTSSDQSGKRKVAMSILPSIRQTKIHDPEAQNQQDDEIDFLNFQQSSDQSGKRKVAMSLLPSIRQTKIQIPSESKAHDMQNNTPQQQVFAIPVIEEHNDKEQDIAKTATLMTVNTLSTLPYSEYSKAEYSQQPFYNISGYAFNSYNGTEKSNNEDRPR